MKSPIMSILIWTRRKKECCDWKGFIQSQGSRRDPKISNALNNRWLLP
jgi:hypothetical protein